MNVVYVKIKDKDEMAFPECYYEQRGNFIVICTIGHPLEVGTFNLSVVEYAYSHHEREKASVWVNKIKSGKPTE